MDLLARVNAILSAFRELLIPGWTVNAKLCPESEMNGALAWCASTPTRTLAEVRVLTPWPASESLEETIAHELTHALLSPLTSLIPQTDASVMLEEQAVERLGIALSKVPLGVARAMVKAVDKYAPRLRARLKTSKPATRRRTNGGSMNLKMFLAALRAALQAEDPKAAIEALLKEIEGMGGEEGEGPETAPPARETEPDPGNTGAAGRDDAEQPGGMARKGNRLVNAEVARVRKAADAATGTAIRGRIRELRSDGLTLPTELEKELAAMTDLDAFERRVSDIQRGRELGNTSNQRARSGQTPNTAKDTTNGEPAVDAATLRAEGFHESFVKHYQEEHAANPEAAKHTLAAARKARQNPDSAAPWKARQQPAASGSEVK